MNKFKKTALFISILVLSSFVLSACGSPKNSDTNINIVSNQATKQITPTIIPDPTLNINTTPTLQPNKDTLVNLTTKYGDILIKLYQNETPNTVANFINKANSGFYNNLTFHRVEPGFVVQGGDPLGTGTGGGSIKSELNSIPFQKGSLGLARTPANKDISNDSQFFICLTTEACSQLTGDYVNFGEVISGFDNVQKIIIYDKIIKIIQK
ncbi:MAG: peptidylprolyl isomerase [Candidatus Shapirobacteria bacterium]|nr:peptidylprolyl isomerase [Candidatus Shapirobacteria bacterium]